jgi:hypothetical protein
VKRGGWVLASGALVVALSVTGWVLHPTEAPRWLAALAIAAVSATVLAVARRARPWQTRSQREFLSLAVVVAALMLVAALLVALAGARGQDISAVAARVRGLAVGLALVVLGNALPRVLGRLAPMRLAEAGEAQASRRWTGSVLALAGLVSLGSFALASLERAELVSALVTAGALVLTLGRPGRARASPPSSR